MKKGQLTKAQLDTLSYMLQFTKEYGRRPTYREIAHHFDLASPGTAYQRVKRLESSLGICPWCQQALPDDTEDA